MRHAYIEMSQSCPFHFNIDRSIVLVQALPILTAGKIVSRALIRCWLVERDTAITMTLHPYTIWTHGNCQAVSPTAWERGYHSPEVVFFGAIFKRVSSPLPPWPGGDGNVLKVSKVPAVVTGWDDQDGLPLIKTDGTYHSARCRVKSDHTHFAPLIITPFAILLHFIVALNDIIEQVLRDGRHTVNIHFIRIELVAIVVICGEESGLRFWGISKQRRRNCACRYHTNSTLAKTFSRWLLGG